MDARRASAPIPEPLDVDLSVLELLVRVAEQGSLGAAARSAGMAQPNVSRSLARLERRLGLILLQRSPSGSSLTPEGSLVVQWAREVLDAAERLRTGAAALSGERSSQLTVAASMTVAEHLLPTWLAAYHRAHTEVTVRVEVHNSYDVFDLVLGGGSDLGFVESPEAPRGLHTTVVAHDRLVVVVAPGHPWSRRRRPLTAADLAATPLIVREPGSGTRLTLESLLERRGLAPVAPALELSSNAAVRGSVAAGVAPAVLGDLAVADALRAGDLVTIEVEDIDLRRSLRAVWRPPRRLLGPAGDLVALARLGTARGAPVL
jgi:DNA-binding transcriptional LysR family regulator